MILDLMRHASTGRQGHLDGRSDPPLLDGVVGELQRTVLALREMAETVGMGHGTAVVTEVLAAGVAGQQRIPGKHGSAPSAYREISVIVADKPGELARLFAAIGDAEVNLEDIRIEHVFGRPSGLVALFVLPEAGERLIDALATHGFDVRA